MNRIKLCDVTGVTTVYGDLLETNIKISVPEGSGVSRGRGGIRANVWSLTG